MTRTEKSLDEQYKPYLIKLMSFKDGVNYASDREFTNEELAQITPETIVRWMCIRGTKWRESTKDMNIYLQE